MGLFDGFVDLAAPLLGFAGSAGGTYINAKMQKRGQKFEHDEAILNREFQAQQFDKGMEFNSAQAALGRDFDNRQGGRSRVFNRQEAQKNRDFQERMATTQYQRAVGDLKKAGLNPMLAYMKGGNDVPSGAMASSSPVHGSTASAGGSPGGSKASWPGNVDYSKIGSAVTDAFSIKQRAEEIKNITETNSLIKAQTEATRTQANLNTASASEHIQRVENLKTQIEEMKEHIRTMLTQQGDFQASAGEKSSRRALNDMMAKLVDAQINLTTNHADLYKAQTAVERVMLELRGYEIPGAKAEAGMRSSWWGQNVSPYVRDVLGIAGSAAALHTVFGTKRFATETTRR